MRTNDELTEYWIRDLSKRVLGPLSLAALRGLVATGRLKDVASISLDGRTWVALGSYPGLVDLVAAPQPGTRELAAQDRQQAAEVRSRLIELQPMQDADIFKVSCTATAEEFLTAFFALAKSYHPDRVPDGFPELRAASAEMVHFITDRINSRIRRAHARPVAMLTSNSPLPRLFDGSQFVGLERTNAGGYRATVRVTQESASMFTRHSMANLSSSGIFLPGLHALLGSAIDLVFQFAEAGRDIKTPGKVVWVNAHDTRRPLGSGVRYGRLPDDETAFIIDYVERALA
jgi:Tfp pilus assembly protein PilZ